MPGQEIFIIVGVFRGIWKAGANVETKTALSASSFTVRAIVCTYNMTFSRDDLIFKQNLDDSSVLAFGSLAVLLVGYLSNFSPLLFCCVPILRFCGIKTLGGLNTVPCVCLAHFFYSQSFCARDNEYSPARLCFNFNFNETFPPIDCNSYTWHSESHELRKIGYTFKYDCN